MGDVAPRLRRGYEEARGIRVECGGYGWSAGDDRGFGFFGFGVTEGVTGGGCGPPPSRGIRGGAGGFGRGGMAGGGRGLPMGSGFRRNEAVGAVRCLVAIRVWDSRVRGNDGWGVGNDVWAVWGWQGGWWDD